LSLFEGVCQGISSRRSNLDLEGLLLSAMFHFQLETSDERRDAGMSLEALKTMKK
jgi:hypothetical protein